jgi:hypothetical protein
VKSWWCGLWFLCACSAGTAGELVPIALSVEVDGQAGAAPGSFDTESGWHVELEEARLALGSVLVYAPEQSAAWRSLFIGHARAHGGFDPFNGRRVRAEYVGPVELDLLAPEPRELGSLDAEAGRAADATLTFDATLAERAAQGFVRGSARRDGEVLHFAGALELADERLLRRVDAIPADFRVGAGGRIRVHIALHALFSEAHFERLTKTVAGEHPITAASQVHTAWVFGLRSPRTYRIEWSKP